MNKDGIGRYLVERRDTLDVSQSRLAELSGVSVHTLSNLEPGNGNVTLDTLLEVVGILELKVEIGVCNGTVFYRDIVAGTLMRDADDYTFRHAPSYLADSRHHLDISATLPKSCLEYRNRVLSPISMVCSLVERRQKDRQCRELHIDEKDHFTRLRETSA